MLPATSLTTARRSSRTDSLNRPMEQHHSKDTVPLSKVTELLNRATAVPLSSKGTERPSKATAIQASSNMEESLSNNNQATELPPPATATPISNSMEALSPAMAVSSSPTEHPPNRATAPLASTVTETRVSNTEEAPTATVTLTNSNNMGRGSSSRTSPPSLQGGR